MRLVHDGAHDDAHRLWQAHDEAVARLADRFRGLVRQRGF